MNIIGHHVAPVPNFSGHPAFLLVVLVEGGARDYAAYAGIVPLPGDDREGRLYNSGHPDYRIALESGCRLVAYNGSKLRFEEARRHFPSIRQETYRA